MSIPLPKWCPATGDTIDPDDWNDNFRILYDEMSGRLNEHNHQSSAFQRTDLDPSAVYRATHVHGDDETTPTQFTTGVNTYATPRDGAWHQVIATTFGDTTGTEFPGGLVWFIASFQASFDLAGGESRAQDHQQFALRIDGVLIPETITGSGEPDNDLIPTGDDSNPPFPGPTIEDDGVGVHTIEAVSLDWLLEIDPGVHTVELVARRAVLNLGSVPNDGYVKNRELIVLALVN